GRRLRQHRGKDGERDFGLVAEPADGALARIQLRKASSRGGEGVPVPVVGADRITKPSVGGRASELLYPGMFVWRHRLRRELTSEPVGLLRKHDSEASASCGERRRDSAEAATHDQHVTGRLMKNHLFPNS